MGNRALLELALQRPLNHTQLSGEEQWAVDKRLGILDWDPTPDETEEYVRRRAQMGDTSCQEYLRTHGLQAEGSPAELVGLLDLDGTFADYDGQMQRDLEALRGPTEEPYVPGPGDGPPHIEARMSVIKRQPGWWRNLPEYEPGFRLIRLLRKHGFILHVVSKGPRKTTTAWTEKVDWVREHLPDAMVTLTEDKGLVYGKVLVDDYPAYALRWLMHRPRGLVLMPAHPWNADFAHPNVIRYTGTPEEDALIDARLAAIAEDVRKGSKS